ncbi:hypothetical protein D3C86_1049470 [compost metagenome]
MEQQIIQLKVYWHTHKGFLLSETINRCLHRINSEDNFTAVHDILIDFELIQFIESLERAVDDNRFIMPGIYSYLTLQIYSIQSVLCTDCSKEAGNFRGENFIITGKVGYKILLIFLQVHDRIRQVILQQHFRSAQDCFG